MKLAARIGLITTVAATVLCGCIQSLIPWLIPGEPVDKPTLVGTWRAVNGGALVTVAGTRGVYAVTMAAEQKFMERSDVLNAAYSATLFSLSNVLLLAVGPEGMIMSKPAMSGVWIPAYMIFKAEVSGDRLVLYPMDVASFPDRAGKLKLVPPLLTRSHRDEGRYIIASPTEDMYAFILANIGDPTFFSSEPLVVLDREAVKDTGESNVVAFADENFAEAVRSSIGGANKPSNGVLAGDVVKLTWLDVSNSEISGMSEMGMFSQLRHLECSQNLLTSLDVSGCAELQTLSCGENPLTNLNVRGCAKLKELVIGGKTTSLSALDLSRCLSLEMLRCKNSGLTAINVSAGKALSEIDCSGNQLTDLDLRGLFELDTVSCKENAIRSIELAGRTKLKTLNAGKNALTNLNVSGCTNLSYLECGNNAGDALRLQTTDCPSLEYFGCMKSHAVGKVDLASSTSIRSVQASVNSLTEIVVKSSALQDIFCSGNRLTDLDLSACPNVKRVDCADNSISAINLSGRTGLVELRCGQNPLTNLDVSGCSQLETLSCSGNKAESMRMNLSGCRGLRLLDCSRGGLAGTLDLSGCTNLVVLNAKENNLSEIIIWSTNCPPREFKHDPGVRIRSAGDVR